MSTIKKIFLILSILLLVTTTSQLQENSLLSNYFINKSQKFLARKYNVNLEIKSIEFDIFKFKINLTEVEVSNAGDIKYIAAHKIEIKLALFNLLLGSSDIFKISIHRLDLNIIDNDLNTSEKEKRKTIFLIQ